MSPNDAETVKLGTERGIYVQIGFSPDLLLKEEVREAMQNWRNREVQKTAEQVDREILGQLSTHVGTD